jgi:hypothetical protein
MKTIKYWNIRDWAIVLVISGYITGIIYMVSKFGV